MVIITKITTQQKNKDRYNVYIDEGVGEKYGFSVDEDILIKFNLKKGTQLSADDLAELNYSDNVKKALNTAINYLARRMRSEGEVRDHLKSKDIVESVVDQVIDNLYSYKYLDDQQFAEAYVKTQVNTTDKGPNNIRLELNKKGISETIIEKILLGYTIEEQINKALIVAKKYTAKNSRHSSRILIEKTRELLLRKGYPHNVISIVIDELDFIREEDDEIALLKQHAKRAHRRFNQLPSFEYNQKMKQTLYRRGFSIELIDKVLNDDQLREN